MASVDPKKLALTGNVLCYGAPSPLPRAVPLVAGPLSLELEDGSLRSIFLGEREIVKQIYVAVRDPDWATVPGHISGLTILRDRNAFLIRFRSEHRLSPLRFVWHGEIEGGKDGAIRFAMCGEAKTNFKRARIGICVLHPVDSCAGLPCQIERGDSRRKESARFPVSIDANAPVQGFHSMSGLHYEAAPGIGLHFRFEGDLFEMEDQRNWTDASFKTFCTPLQLPIPVAVSKGTILEQSLSLRLTGVGKAHAKPRSRKKPVLLKLSGETSGNLAAIGFGAASHLRSLKRREWQMISQLGPAHLRVDLDFEDVCWESRLELAVGDARKLRCPLLPALVNAPRELAEDFLLRLAKYEIAAPAWLLYPYSDLLARQIKRKFPAAKIGAGTNANFISFNENPPKGAYLDAASFAIHPQTHATDNRSVMETLEVQGRLVAKARELCGKPIIVSPVTLKPRFNPDAAGVESGPKPGELPSQVDVRQMSLFAAAWTVGSVKYLSEAGAEQITYYETSGWRGLVEAPEGSALPVLFRSFPGAAFPVYQVFAWLAPFRGCEAIRIVSGSPLQVVGLAARKRGHTRILLSNLTGDEQIVALEGAPPVASVLTLDERNAQGAMLEPRRFARRKGQARRTAQIRLPRFSVARVDFEEAAQKGGSHA